MQDWFLQRSRAKLAVAEILGLLDRWVRSRLRESSLGDLLMVSRHLSRRCKELASEDTPGKNPSMGSRRRIWEGHPLRKYLDQELDRRVGPIRTPLDDLSTGELDSYIMWLRVQPPDDVDRLSTDERLAQWSKERPRVLPILPRGGSLPSNVHVRRTPNHRERGGRSGDSSKTGQAEEAPTPFREAEAEVPLSL